MLPSSDDQPAVVEGIEAIPVHYETFDEGHELQRALTIKQVAHWLRVSEAEVSRLAERGELPGRRIGNDWRFGAVALNQWIANERNEPRSVANPTPPELVEIVESWRALEAVLAKVLEPIVGTEVHIASEGGIAFSGSFVTADQLEKAYLLYVLAKHEGNKGHAASILGIDPSTLYRKLNSF